MRVRYYDNGKIKYFDYVKLDINIHFNDNQHTDEDDNKVKYTKTCYYIPNQVRIGIKLLDLLTDGVPANVRKLLHYIIHHLEYGKNYLTISNKYVCAEEGHISNGIVSNALKWLKDKEIIYKARDLDAYKDDVSVGAKEYIVNPNYIFKGNYNEAKKQLDIQGNQSYSSTGDN